MYQFYYADFTPHSPGEFKENIRHRFQITALRPAMWEEHCLECSAPACFESCVHYQARSDGRCKRFFNGLQTFPHENACCGQGVHVQFRKWGNMMTVLFPAMLTEADYRKLWMKNQQLGKLLKTVESSPVPQSLRWQSIRIPEFLRRRRLRKLRGACNTADAFLFHGYSYSTESYRLILEVYDDHTPVSKTAIPIQPGENLAVIQNLAPEFSSANHLVKLYPENDLEAELDILWCDFVQGHPIAPEAPAPTVKCLVWDLDNTLWDGTLVETDDPKTLALKPGVRGLMEALDQRGILQSVASKNDHAAAMAVLEDLGIADYFLYPQIHWQPKSSSMEAIAKSLNIGIDALAFIDDTAFERHQVASRWPQIRTYDAEEVGRLPDLPEFDVPVTPESRNRRSMYLAEARRSILMQAQHTDITDFIRRCHLKLRVFTPETEDEILRCYELTVRTNQLNLTGKKYGPEEFRSALHRPGHRNFAFSCSDDFGEYGIVGFGQYRSDGDSLVFTEFAMSCRVAGKFVESALFSHLLRAEGARTGTFPVQKTQKNILLRNTLEQIGFYVTETSPEAVCYRFSEDLYHNDLVSL